MCGIFGFALRQAVSTEKVFNVLQRLEAHQLPTEPRPVGGYGAGIAFAKEDGKVSLVKTGKTSDSPVECLRRIVEPSSVSVLLGHVRMPSPEFMATARFKEAAQPYVAKCLPGSTVVSVHNGKVENYLQMKSKLGSHVFESQQSTLIDSEVIPHYFEILLAETRHPIQARDALYSSLQGSNTAAVMQIGETAAFLHLFHKGKTRGLNVWSNEEGELVFSSRKEPLILEFGDVLTEKRFKERAEILCQQEAELVLTFPFSVNKKQEAF